MGMNRCRIVWKLNDGNESRAGHTNSIVNGLLSLGRVPTRHVLHERPLFLLLTKLFNGYLHNQNLQERMVRRGLYTGSVDTSGPFCELVYSHAIPHHSLFEKQRKQNGTLSSIVKLLSDLSSTR